MIKNSFSFIHSFVLLRDIAMKRLGKIMLSTTIEVRGSEHEVQKMTGLMLQVF